MIVKIIIISFCTVFSVNQSFARDKRHHQVKVNTDSGSDTSFDRGTEFDGEIGVILPGGVIGLDAGVWSDGLLGLVSFGSSLRTEDFLS